jgi:hypothetical protein
MEVAREERQFLLRRRVFRSGSIKSGRGGVWLAAGLARGRFGVSGFFLFVRSGLRSDTGTSEEQ